MPYKRKYPSVTRSETATSPLGERVEPAPRTSYRGRAGIHFAVHGMRGLSGTEAFDQEFTYLIRAAAKQFKGISKRLFMPLSEYVLEVVDSRFDSANDGAWAALSQVTQLNRIFEKQWDDIDQPILQRTGLLRSSYRVIGGKMSSVARVGSNHPVAEITEEGGEVQGYDDGYALVPIGYYKKDYKEHKAGDVKFAKVEDGTAIPPRPVMYFTSSMIETMTEIIYDVAASTFSDRPEAIEKLVERHRAGAEVKAQLSDTGAFNTPDIPF